MNISGVVVAITYIGVGGHLPAQTPTSSPTMVLDSFDSVSQWTMYPAAGVEITVHPDPNGAHGRAMRLDFDFHGHGGYAVVHRALKMTLPPKYEFSFAIRGAAPTNTLEFKLVDSTGASTWWSNNPNFHFPRNWETITRNKRQIFHAWGPTRDFDLKKTSAIEFAITAGSGGKGSVWLDDLAITPITPPALGSVAFSILLIAAGAAFTRAPLLRRRLLALGSPRYTATPVTRVTRNLTENMDALSTALGGGKSAPDSLIVWVLMLVSAVLVIGLLGQIWPQQPNEIWGVGFIALGVAAFAYSRRRAQADAEIAHVALTAAVLWILIGVARLLPTPESVPACALVAALVINSVKRQLAAPRALAKLTIGLTLLVITGYELSSSYTGLVHLRWVVSEIVTLGVAAFIARQLVAETADETQGMVFAAATYLTGLVVVWSVLGPVWAPLVTTSYAILGAVLLILSRREGARPLLRYLGGVTMVIVVGRLLLVDLASVETIWRVLLFLVCGAVFLYTGYRMQRATPANSRLQ